MSTMKKKLVNDTLIQLGDPLEKLSIADKVIECNINMNVSLSNQKRTWIFYTTQCLLTIILIITFLITHFQLRREIHLLEAQMNLINSNLAIFISRSERFYKNYSRTDIQDLITKFHPHGDDFEKFYYKVSTEASTDSYNTKSEKFRIDDNGVQARDNLNNRVIRSVVTFEEHNKTENIATLNNVNGVVKDDSTIWNDAKAGRIQRDVGRGKQRRVSERKLKRSRRRLGPLVVTFVGAVPEQHITDTVYIGPWVKKNESRYSFNKFHLVEDKRSIEVTANGLFMISTQIYYFGEPSHYSYWILLSSEGSSTTRKVIKCASAAPISATETSCYTSVILPLRRGDRLYIQQQERDRLINLREGHSYIQLTLLSNDQPKRRMTTSSNDRL